MKKYASLLISFLLALVLVACRPQSNQTHTISGQVSQINPDGFNLRDQQGQEYQIITSTSNQPELQAGDQVRVDFDGTMAMSNPPQITNPSDIVVDKSLN
ncbi:hypothetical protein AWM75_01475 [Aerococcus urinaehominis]|uniref:Uncharacterized protein n=1 Tax=Aerococcus urinaehominis TaxID=128944 RepID=A0A0X8FK27_9LACT|nr:hypothetical protein [Aerococcus urinaehominis]AMB98745.1 hypothetical protein AWM75_01475 [Aerococcus urinaehominis]SDM14362.1 hypothetical protein SAMN04487985_10666 [Aerococcus urinaehominis]